MHFRIRNRIIQVVRTSYDPVTQKPKTQILGRMNRDAPEIGDELRLSCQPDELSEIKAYLKNRQQRGRLELEMAARSLADQMRLAAEWFDTATDTAENRALAGEILRQFPTLRKKTQHLVDAADPARKVARKSAKTLV